MQIAWMQTFVAVAEELHFGRAAQRLNVAQPAVSQQIQNLEKDLGARLFDRDKRSVRLTDAGEAFLEPCRKALMAIDDAASRARNAGTGEFGRLRVGHNAGFGVDHFIQLMQVVSHEYPNIQLEVDSSRTNAENLGLLQEGRLDLVMVGGPITGTGIAWQPLDETVFGVLLPRDHALAGRTEVSMAELAEEAFVLMKPTAGRTLRYLVEELCEEAGFVPRKVMEVKDAMSLLTLVASGLGVGFSPAQARDTTPATLVVVPLSESPTAQIGLAWREAAETPALSNVVRLARSRFALGAAG